MLDTSESDEVLSAAVKKSRKPKPRKPYNPQEMMETNFKLASSHVNNLYYDISLSS